MLPSMPTYLPKSQRLTSFTFLPDTIRFGADAKLTVVTVYLALTDDLIAVVKQRRTRKQTGEPVAIIVSYDIECNTLALHCIDSNDTHCIIALSRFEERMLYASFCEYTQEGYGYTPKEMLNAIRNYANLPAL